MKIVYIAPHLSTGGSPQYLLKKIQVLHKEHEVYCIEYADHGCFTVQKNQIKEILQDRYFEVNYDRPKLLNIIENISPDVVHLEEMPEYFMDGEISRKLYSPSRKYKLIETSHDSSFDPNTKVFFPDKIIFVSEYQRQTLKSLGVAMDVCEYPIGIRPRKDRNAALKVLGLDPNKKHVINVGLFTPRKNQAEIIEYARKLKDYPVVFHFIGNQADNFKFYWEPLMKDFPDNCVWWNERKDVDNFYQAADLFLFTSRGTVTDKETSPLVIREAISYNIPSLIYNLPVYMNMYNKYDNIKYLDFDSPDTNEEKIIQILGIQKESNIMNKKKPRKKLLHNDYFFRAKWNLFEQKMSYSSTKGVDFPILVTLREYKSDAVLWSTEYDSFPANCEFWMIPVPKEARDYSNYEYFSGIKLCIYRKDNEEQIFEQPFFEKFVNLPTISMSNKAPYHFNYLEYFVEEKYSKWLNETTKFHTAVDVGANIGIFTEFLIRKKIAKKITAIECNESALKDLIRNYEFNDNVKIIPKALSHSNDPITFYNCPENSVISSTIPPSQIAQHRAGLLGSQEVKVDTVTIKNLVDDLKHINLLKIDIEGAEYNLFDKLDPTLAEYIDNMFIECHFFEADYKDKYYKLLDIVRSMGYVIDEAITKPLDHYSGSSECIFAYKK